MKISTNINRNTMPVYRIHGALFPGPMFIIISNKNKLFKRTEKRQNGSSKKSKPFNSNIDSLQNGSSEGTVNGSGQARTSKTIILAVPSPVLNIDHDWSRGGKQTTSFITISHIFTDGDT